MGKRGEAATYFPQRIPSVARDDSKLQRLAQVLAALYKGQAGSDRPEAAFVYTIEALIAGARQGFVDEDAITTTWLIGEEDHPGWAQAR